MCSCLSQPPAAAASAPRRFQVAPAHFSSCSCCSSIASASNTSASPMSAPIGLGGLRRCTLWSSQLRSSSTCRWRRAALATQASSDAGQSGKKRIVFLGTPEVAAIVLEELMQASKADTASFEVAAVVSQPGKPKGRGNKAVPVPSPVEVLARQHQLPDAAILCPKSAKEPAFLEALAALQPDLAVTAAYGNMLPTPFLNIPRHGTLNIHPSLLPQYRGAAPVQRAVQDGVAETGVSVAFTVLKCDAGPIFLQERVMVPEDEQAPQLLERLFRRGAQLLVSNLPRVWSGEAASTAWQQDEAAATHAAKISKEESLLDFAQHARVLHNQVRGFAGWPGAFATFHVSAAGAAAASTMVVKVLRSRVADEAEAAALLAGAPRGGVVFADGGARLLVPCGGGGALEVLELQPLTKKAMAPKALFNGLAGKQLSVMH